MQRQEARREAQKAILTGVEQKINTGHWDAKIQKEALAKYQAKGGDPQSFINYVVKVQTERSLPRQRRLEGIPSDSMSSIIRHDNFNR
jgi:hypothetical protein